jgi:hypothetical protein
MPAHVRHQLESQIMQSFQMEPNPYWRYRLQPAQLEKQRKLRENIMGEGIVSSHTFHSSVFGAFQCLNFDLPFYNFSHDCHDQIWISLGKPLPSIYRTITFSTCPQISCAKADNKARL